MFVYVKNWNIVYRTNTRTNIIPGAMEIKCWFNLNDNLVFEDWEVRIYEKSKQFEKDIHKYQLKTKIKNLEFENKKLEKAANENVKEKMELRKDATKFDRELYLLRQMKQCWKRSWWQEID